MSAYVVVAKSMAEAMKLARERYGDNVFILNQQDSEFGVKLHVGVVNDDRSVTTITNIEKKKDERPKLKASVDESPQVAASSSVELNAIAQLENEIRQLSKSVKKLAVTGPVPKLLGIPDRVLEHFSDIPKLTYAGLFKEIDRRLRKPLLLRKGRLHLWDIANQGNFELIAKIAVEAQRRGLQVKLGELEIDPSQRQMLEGILHHGRPFSGEPLLLTSSGRPRKADQIWGLVSTSVSSEILTYNFKRYKPVPLLICGVDHYGDLSNIVDVVAQFETGIVGMSVSPSLSSMIAPINARKYAPHWLQICKLLAEAEKETV